MDELRGHKHLAGGRLEDLYTEPVRSGRLDHAVVHPRIQPAQQSVAAQPFARVGH
jgi:hypothetical protein